MKRLVVVCLAVLFVLALVLVYRAETHFTEQNVETVPSQEVPKVDITAASSRLAKAISYPTISYDDPGRRDDAAFTGLREHMLFSFPGVHTSAPPRIVNEHSLLFKFPGSRSDLKPALFMGHVDVVPVDDATADQWRFPAFSGAIEDGVIWGRGAMDDKVTVFALLEAMESLLE